MSPALGRLRYFLADAWDEFRHSPGANLLAAATLAAVLVLAAALLVVVRNLDRQLDRWREDVHVDVYLRDDADPARVDGGGAINFITGPARTADIELTLTRAVHGPKEVHAIFVDAGPA